ncbi:MAG: hypothetical protein IJX98_06705 [Clostridia bacterium]|nr:hypothetical protein [Clostridia bacterium]
MKNFSSHRAPEKRGGKLVLTFFLVLTLAICALLFSSCNREVDYYDFVSELRSNLFLFDGEDYSIRVQDVEKEYPYVSDGYISEMTHKTEIFVLAPSGTTHCNIYFHCNGKTYGGEASFDSVKREYYYSCNADISEAPSLPVRVQFGENSHEITLPSVKTQSTLSAPDALQKLVEAETELFSSLTDGGDFLGEIYIRLLYEDAPYYYIGVVNRNGTSAAFLLDATTGKVLAKRTT